MEYGDSDVDGCFDGDYEVDVVYIFILFFVCEFWVNVCCIFLVVFFGGLMWWFFLVV